MKKNFLFLVLFFCVVSQTLAQIPSYVPTNGLVAWYPFNGNANDESGNGNHGTVNGATLTTDRFGNEGKAFSFNGVNNYIQVPNSSSLENINSITISAWININQLYQSGGAGFFPILHKSNQQGTYGKYDFGIWNPNIIAHLNDQGTAATFSLTLAVWQNFSVVISNNVTIFYINGLHVWSGTSGSWTNNSNHSLPLVIGMDRPGLIEYANGKIDDIAIYNRALTQQEITNLYNATTNTTPCAANIINRDTTICQGQSVVLNAASIVSGNTSGNVNSVTDIDGNVYSTVNIGTQTWTQKNLNVSRYRNGDLIPQVTDLNAWGSLTSGAWCWYRNDSTTYGSTYGKLYNWYAVNDPRGLAPEGWHVSTDNDWTALSSFLGGDSRSGEAIKSLSGWYNNGNGTNSSGLNALPGGYRGVNGGIFEAVGYFGLWWTSSDFNSTYSWYRQLNATNNVIIRAADLNKFFGFSVRIVKDTINNYNNYLWSTGATTPSITVTPTQSTTYFLTAISGNTTCRDSARITVINVPTNFFAQDTIGVCGTSQTISAPSDMSSYAWSTGASTRNITVNQSGWYRCTITSGNCSSADSVYVNLVSANIVNRDTTFCSGSSLNLNSTSTTQRNINVGVFYLENGFSPILDTTVWHHIAVTKSGLNGALYIDGNLVKNSTFTGDPFIWNSILFGATQGCLWCTPVPNYSGMIDEVRISNRARTSSEIRNAYLLNQPFSIDANTLAEFSFDNPNGTTLTNLVNSSTGTLYGGVQYSSGRFGNGVQFDGFDDYIRFPISIPVNDMSIELWYKSSDTQGIIAMFEYAYNTGIYINRTASDGDVNISPSLLWSTGATTPSITVTPSQSTTYYLTATSGNTTCRDSVRVTVTSINNNFFPQDTIRTCGSSYALTAGPTFTAYSWNTGDAAPSIIVRNSGWYRCTVRNSNCYATDSVYIEFIRANITNNDTTICLGQPVVLNGVGTGTASNSSFVTDIDGNLYPTVNIGTQVWFAENLKTTRFSDGNNIPNVVDGTWLTTLNPAWAYYNNDSANNRVYGKLYNFYTASNPSNACPAGWRVPTLGDFNILLNYLGGSRIAGGKMKDTIYWNLPNNGATNSSGFSAKPAGIKYAGGPFGGLGGATCWWTSSLSTSNQTLGSCKFSDNGRDSIVNYEDGKNVGWSIRCLRNQTSTPNISALLWSTGATTPTITVTPTQSTTYYLSATSGNTTCRDSVRINITNFNANPITQDTIITCNATYTIIPAAGYTRYTWSNGTVTRNNTVRASGWYKLTVIIGNCSATDSVYIKMLSANILNRDTTICRGQSVTLNADQGGSGLPSNLRNGLVGYWPFNGNANDESGNGNHGVVNGATLTEDRFGNSGKAYGFNQTNISVPMTLQLHDLPIRTFSFWFNANGNQNGGRIYETSYLNGGIGLYNGNILDAWYSNGAKECNVTNVNTGSLNIWHQVVYITDCHIGHGSIYLDGNLISSRIGNSTLAPQNWLNNFLKFGMGAQAESFKGALDEIAIWNRALSPSEVTQLYQSTGSGNLLWSTGAATPSITVTPATSTTYFLTVSEGYVSCQDTVRVNVTPFVQNPILADTVYACGRSTSITAQSGCLRYSWSNGAVTPTITVNNSGWYYLTAVSSKCTAYDSVYVQFINANILNNDTSICLGQSVSLNAEQGGSGLASNLRNGLVGYWPFNGNANDESGNGNHGTVNGATLANDRFGNSGKAYGFNQTNISVPMTLQLHDLPIRTFSFWFNANGNQNGGRIYETSYLNGGIGLYNGNILGAWYYNGVKECNVTNVNTGSLNIWHHIVYVTDCHIGHGSIYLDGNLISSRIGNSYSAPQNWLNNFLKFGMGAQGESFKGALDEIAIWNRALSPSEVTELYQFSSLGNRLWSTGATTPSITVTPTTNTTYYLTASQGNVSCRDSVRVNVTNISLGIPGAITGNTDACASIGADSAYRYTIRKVLGATSYQWTVPAGATLVSGQGDTAVRIKFGSTYVSGGQISVAARSDCNQLSQPRTLSVTRPSLQTPVGIQQSFSPSVAAVYSVCGLNNAIYRIRKVTGATGYVWTLRRGFNASIVSLNGTGVNDTAIQINFQNGFLFDTISVRAISGCAQSGARTLVLNTNYTPAKVQAITTQGGNFVACIGQPMTLTAIPATPLSYQSALSRYSWTLPTGAFVVSASSSDSATITINFNSNFRGGSVSVRGRSACTNTFCGTTSAILKYYPPTPLSIVSGTGSYNACVGDQVTYTVLVPSPSSSQTQAVRFRWTLPLSTTIVSATADSSSVTVRFLNNFNGGRLMARGITDCGNLGNNFGQILTHNGCAPGTKLPVTSRRSEQTKQSFTAKLYPNPTTTDFRVQLEGMNKMPVVIKTMDVQGRLISSKQYQPSTIISIETPKSAGTYWIEVRQGESVVVLKGVKVG